MRGLIFAAYFVGCGYAIAALHLDEDIARLAESSYRALLKHTVKTIRDVDEELGREIDASAGRAARHAVAG
jgi:hypothetical protein